MVMSNNRQLTKSSQPSAQPQPSSPVGLSHQDLAQIIGGITGSDDPPNKDALNFNHNETVVNDAEAIQEEAQTMVEMFEADLEVIVGGLNIIQLNHNETVVNDAEAVQEEAQTMVEMFEADLEVIVGGLNVIQVNHNETVIRTAAPSEPTQKQTQTIVELSEADLEMISGGIDLDRLMANHNETVVSIAKLKQEKGD